MPNICNRCQKEIKLLINYKRHINRKTPCVILNNNTNSLSKIQGGDEIENVNKNVDVDVNKNVNVDENKNVDVDKNKNVYENKNVDVNENKIEEFKMPNEVIITPKDAYKYFHLPTHNKNKSLRFTDVSLYSTTPYYQSLYLSDLLLNYYSPNTLKEKIITDLGACIGGNVWSFAKKTKYCFAIEISKLHCDIMKDNMKLLDINNITIYNKNYFDIKDDIKQDLMFLDPPWGGLDYKKNVTLNYIYNNKIISLDELIDNYLINTCEFIMIKVPKNISDELLNKIKKSKFSYYELIDIYTKDESILYKLIILSNVKKIKNIAIKKFDRIQYRGIKYSFKF